MNQTYQFTFAFRCEDLSNPNPEDALYESGCSDCLISYTEDMIYLDFDREAPTMGQAVFSAIENIKSAGIFCEGIK